MNESDLLSFVHALADLIAEKVIDRMERRLISQHASPLGRRRHRAAVKRRIERGDPGASIIDRNHYLTPQALNDEIARETQEHIEKTRKKKSQKQESANASPKPPLKPELAALQREIDARLHAVREGQRRANLTPLEREIQSDLRAIREGRAKATAKPRRSK